MAKYEKILQMKRGELAELQRKVKRKREERQKLQKEREQKMLMEQREREKQGLLQAQQQQQQQLQQQSISRSYNQKQMQHAGREMPEQYSAILQPQQQAAAADRVAAGIAVIEARAAETARIAAEEAAEASRMVVEVVHEEQVPKATANKSEMEVLQMVAQ